MPLVQLQGRLTRPEGVDLAGKAAIVTGANGGIGLDTARQLLLLNAGTVVLAVRNLEKGEKAKDALISDKDVQEKNPNAIVRVMKLDMADYQSVWEFSKNIKAELPTLHILILNAAVANVEYTKVPSGHDQITQVNYFSNVLLLLELLPLLESTAEKTNSPSRVTWVGSLAFLRSRLAKNVNVEAGETIVEYLDDPKNYGWFARYFDSKQMSRAFVREIAKHISPTKIIVNDLCPGMVETNITGTAPAYFRLPWAVFSKLFSRSAEQGAWAEVHSAVVAGPESHGKFYSDQKEISSYGVMDTKEGHDLQQQLWKETAAEMRQQGVTLPAFMAPGQ